MGEENNPGRPRLTKDGTPPMSVLDRGPEAWSGLAWGIGGLCIFGMGLMFWRSLLRWTDVWVSLIGVFGCAGILFTAITGIRHSKRRQEDNRRMAVIMGGGLISMGCLVLVAISHGVVHRWETRIETTGQIMRLELGSLCHDTMIYCLKHDGRFPPPNVWNKEIEQVRGAPVDGIIVDPLESRVGRVFSMNSLLAGKKMGDIRFPSKTVLFFECAEGRPLSGGPNDLPSRPRYCFAGSWGYAVGFCDGTVKRVTPAAVVSLIWDPK